MYMTFSSVRNCKRKHAAWRLTGLIQFGFTFLSFQWNGWRNFTLEKKLFTPHFLCPKLLQTRTKRFQYLRGEVTVSFVLSIKCQNILGTTHQKYILRQLSGLSLNLTNLSCILFLLMNPNLHKIIWFISEPDNFQATKTIYFISEPKDTYLFELDYFNLHKACCWFKTVWLIIADLDYFL